MKQVTASEARKHWFRLLDEAAQGEVIVVQRKGRRVVLRREESKDAGHGSTHPEYRRLLRAPGADKADRWSWEWRDAGRGLVARRVPTR
jgi:antitoxin (DNA-binding transcriptional repressor) of toxin-antitoxin stability system